MQAHEITVMRIFTVLQKSRLVEIHSRQSQFLREPLQALISVRPLMAHHLHVHRYR
jgi:hypothetical protein